MLRQASVIPTGSPGSTASSGGDTWEGDESDVRRIDPRTGEVLERLDLPPGAGVSGFESDGGDQFSRGGGRSGR